MADMTDGEMARALAEAYEAESHRQRPGKFIPPYDRAARAFSNAVPLVRAAGVTPEQWAKAVFNRFGTSMKGVIRPHHFNQAGLVQIVAEQSDGKSPEALADLQSRLEVELFEARLQFENPAFILTDPSNALSPLSRFMLANIYGLQEIKGKYRAEAMALRQSEPLRFERLKHYTAAMTARMRAP